MLINIYYSTKDIVENPVFGVGIIDENAKLYYGTNTKVKHCDIPYIKGKGKISVLIDSIPLLSGRYYFQVAIVSSDLKETFDWIQKAKHFIVINATDDIGEILFSCKWDIQQNRQ